MSTTGSKRSSCNSTIDDNDDNHESDTSNNNIVVKPDESTTTLKIVQKKQKPKEDEEADTAEKDGDPIQQALATLDKDLGHRLGNFHNYYSFHPPSHRLQHMQDIFAYIRDSSRENVDADNSSNNPHSRKRLKTNSQGATTATVAPPPFAYCDLGCNQGDLTIQIAKALQGTLQRPVHFMGMDIDSALIDRATENWKSENEAAAAGDDGGGDCQHITGRFVAGNICTDLMTAKAMLDQKVDLISLLSTTMWLHVHVGDEGLQQVLTQMCRLSTRYILLEPQPSKCYRNAMIRLRKMGRPELDVSAKRLKWRGQLEQQMEAVLKKHGFHRVHHHLPSENEKDDRTSWNRSIHLYEKQESED